MSNFRLSDRSLSRLEGVDPRFISGLKMAIQISEIDFGIPRDGGVRTAERQLQLCQDGASKCDGTTNISYHQIHPNDPRRNKYGSAFDVYALGPGRGNWDPQDLTYLGGLITGVMFGEFGIRLTWGGTFGSGDIRGWDMAHFQQDQDWFKND